MYGPSISLKKLVKLFSLKLSSDNYISSSSSSSSSTMKLKTLIQTLFFSKVRRALRSLSAAKSKADRTLQVVIKAPKRHRKRQNDITKSFFGSFRFHYNWCSSKRHSHVLPVPSPVYDGLGGSHLYYDSTWHSVVPPPGAAAETVDNGGHESRLYGYLQWLEEKKVHGKPYGGVAERHDGDYADVDDPTAENNNNNDDIDKLADMFIASCHAKFILEKQESARRFKEMLERSA